MPAQGRDLPPQRALCSIALQRGAIQGEGACVTTPAPTRYPLPAASRADEGRTSMPSNSRQSRGDLLVSRPLCALRSGPRAYVSSPRRAVVLPVSHADARACPSRYLADRPKNHTRSSYTACHSRCILWSRSTAAPAPTSTQLRLTGPSTCVLWT